MDIPEAILERAEEREARSREYEARYKSGDISALRAFCRIDPFAINTAWVQEGIQKAFLCSDNETLKTVFTGGKGEGKSRITRMTENLVIQYVVDQTAAVTGLPKSTPLPPKDDEETPPETVFDRIYMDQVLNFGRVQELNPRTLANRYHEAKKQTPEAMIERIYSGRILRIGPALFDFNGCPMVGMMKQFLPDDGSDWTLNFTGVFNIPCGHTTTDILPKPFHSSLE